MKISREQVYIVDCYLLVYFSCTFIVDWNFSFVSQFIDNRGLDIFATNICFTGCIVLRDRY